MADISQEELVSMSPEELKEAYIKLQKEQARTQKRMDRFINQGDKQQKDAVELNERLQSYINIIDDHIITISIDNEHYIEAVSTEFLRVFGYKSKEIEKQQFDYMIEKSFSTQFKHHVAEVEKSRLPVKFEIKLLTKAENPIWMEAALDPNIEEAGVNKTVINGFTLICENINDKKLIEELKANSIKEKKYSSDLLEFMSSVSSATLQRTPRSLSIILWVMSFAFVFLMIWANFAQLDEITRGSGKIIPPEHIKKVQNLEGGIVSHINVHDGDAVKKGEVLVELDDLQFLSDREENRINLEKLNMKVARLNAEIDGTPYELSQAIINKNPSLYSQSQSLYQSDIMQHKHAIDALKEKREQTLNDIEDNSVKLANMMKNLKLTKKEFKIKQDLYSKRFISEVEFLQIQRSLNDLEQEIQSIKVSTKKLNATISEIDNSIEEKKQKFLNDAISNRNEAVYEISRLEEEQRSLQDKINRSDIVAPVDGVVKQVLVTTVGQVVQPGETMLEIVPSNQKMIAEVKVKPSDIAYIHLGQQAELKFSAYDYAIHGGIKGKVMHISADTITDDKKNNFYIVRLQLEKNYIGNKKDKKPIKTGMVVDADMLSGQKSVLDYLLKPILRGKNNAFSEH